MTAILIPALLFFACFYVAVNLALAIGVWRTGCPGAPHSPTVSVIVAARNEEKHISALVEHLVRQDYQELEIFVVNDRSTDSTGDLLKALAGRFPKLRTVTITETSSEMPAKKFALEQAITASTGEILCFTDADCLPPKSWVSSLVRCFDTSTGLVAGYSPYHQPDKGRLAPLFSSFLRFEELRAAVWTAGSLGWNLGWLCTGRNLAYRRSVWEEVSGFEKIKHSISGDDDLFLQIVRRTTKWKIRYVGTPESHVPTSPPSSLREFVNQRTRHFSAGKFFTWPMKLFFTAYHSTNLLLYAGLVAGIIGSSPLLVWAFIGKAVSDLAVVLSGQSIDRQPGCVLASPFLEFLYLCYNVFIGPLGMRGSFRWKP